MHKLVLAEQLKKLLKQFDMNLTELSRRTDIAPSTLHGWLNGLEPKSIIQIQRVALYFNISIDYLCFNSNIDYEIQSIGTLDLNGHFGQVKTNTVEIYIKKEIENGY